MELAFKYHDNKVHGANMGPIWGRQDPGRPHVGTMNFAIWVIMDFGFNWSQTVFLTYAYFISIAHNPDWQIEGVQCSKLYIRESNCCRKTLLYAWRVILRNYGGWIKWANIFAVLIIVALLSKWHCPNIFLDPVQIVVDTLVWTYNTHSKKKIN